MRWSSIEPRWLTIRNTGIWWRRLRVASSPVQVRSPVAPISATARTPPKNAPLQIAIASASRATRTCRMALSAAMRSISGATQSSGSEAASRTPHRVSCAWIAAVTSMIDSLLVGRGSRRRRDRLDLDQEFGPREAGDDHQRGGGRRIADIAVAHAHVALEMLAAGHEGVDAHDIGEAEARVREHRADIAEAEVGLLLGAGRHLVVGRDPELARAEEDAMAGRDLDAVAVARERRPDAFGGDVSHGAAHVIVERDRQDFCYTMHPLPNVSPLMALSPSLAQELRKDLGDVPVLADAGLLRMRSRETCRVGKGAARVLRARQADSAAPCPRVSSHTFLRVGTARSKDLCRKRRGGRRAFAHPTVRA